MREDDSHLVIGHTSSGAETLATKAPKAHVVSAFNAPTRPRKVQDRCTQRANGRHLGWSCDARVDHAGDCADKPKHRADTPQQQKLGRWASEA